MKNPGWIIVFLIAAVGSFFCSAAVFCTEPVEKGSQINFNLPLPDSVQTQTYLGLSEMKAFKVSDIKAQMVIIELMSSRCPHCQANAPIMNDIYKKMQADSGLADVKVFAIALADDKAGLETFKKQFKTSFPVLLDESLEITHSMTGLATPTTMIVSTEESRILFIHAGEIPDADKFIKQVKFVKQLEAWDKEK